MPSDVVMSPANPAQPPPPPSAVPATQAPSAPASRSLPVSLPDETVPEYDIRHIEGWIGIDWKEIFHYRELLFFLIWRDVKVRYKQTVLGVAWAVLQPLITMVIFTMVFGRLAKLSDNVPDELKARHIPYSLFVYAGLLPWMFFNAAVSGGGTSLMNAQNLLTKVYFPRLFVPTSVIGAALVDMLVSFVMFFVIMFCSGISPPHSVWMTPILILLTTFAAMGIAYSLAALTVVYRDFRYVVPFMLNCWQFLSPVGYPIRPIALWKQWLVRLNPLDGIINGYRSALLGQHWDYAGLAIAVVEVVIMLILGMAYFRKTERRFADIA